MTHSSPFTETAELTVCIQNESSSASKEHLYVYMWVLRNALNAQEFSIFV